MQNNYYETFLNAAISATIADIDNTRAEAIISLLLVDAADKGLVTPDNSILSAARDKVAFSGSFLKDFCPLLDSTPLTTEDRINVVLGLRRNQLRDKWNSTPESVRNMIFRLLHLSPEDTFYDLGSGDGIVLLEADQYAPHPRLIGTEIVERSAFISEVLLTLAQADFSIYNADVLRQDSFLSYNKAYVFPPFGTRFSGDYKVSEKYTSIFNSRSRVEWYFVFSTMKNLSEDGQLVAFLPDGTLFSASDIDVRKYLLDNKMLQGIISLPSGAIPGTGVKTSLVVIGPSDGTFKLIDASKMIVKHQRDRFFDMDVDAVLKEYEEAEPYTKADAEERDYNLTVPAYSDVAAMDSIDHPAKISDVAQVIVGSQYTVAHFNKNLPTAPTDYQILTSSNIENGMIDYDKLLYINEDKKLDKYALQEGDVIVTTKSTIVKTVVATGLPARRIIVTGGMLIVRPDKEKINPTYLKMYLDSETGKNVLRAIQKGATITTIPTQAFREISVACPDINKQNVLAIKYNTMLGMYAGMKKQMDNLKLQIDSLYDSSLEPAEEGDNPADGESNGDGKED